MTDPKRRAASYEVFQPPANVPPTSTVPPTPPVAVPKPTPSDIVIDLVALTVTFGGETRPIPPNATYFRLCQKTSTAKNPKVLTVIVNGAKA